MTAYGRRNCRPSSDSKVRRNPSRAAPPWRSPKPLPRELMPIQPAERMAHIGQETAFEVLVRARALEATGRHVVHLEIGEPDFDTPGHIIAAAQEALEAGRTHYGPGA